MRRPGMKVMSRSANSVSSAADASGAGGIGARQRDRERDLAGVAHAALGQRVVQQQGALARRRRALERRAADADRPRGPRRTSAGSPPAAPPRPRSRTRCRPRRAGRGVHVVVGAQRDDEHVGLVDARVGGHPLRLGVDRGDRLLEHAHAGLGDVAVLEADRVGRRAPNITSSFEKPKTNASVLSISVTSTSSATASESMVLSSRPPNPAPRMTTRWLILRP